MLENKYQSYLVKKLKSEIPGCVVLKNDPNYIQGIPDLIVLFGKKWACLEVKKNHISGHQPNQDYYISLMNKMSFASFIYPENEDEVIGQRLFYFQEY